MSVNTLSLFSIAELENRSQQKGLTPDAYVASLFALEANQASVTLSPAAGELALILENHCRDAEGKPIEIPKTAVAYNNVPALTVSTNTFSTPHVKEAIKSMMRAAGISELAYEVKNSLSFGAKDKQLVALSDSRSIEQLAQHIINGRLSGSFIGFAYRY